MSGSWFAYGRQRDGVRRRAFYVDVFGACPAHVVAACQALGVSVRERVVGDDELAFDIEGASPVVIMDGLSLDAQRTDLIRRLRASKERKVFDEMTHGACWDSGRHRVSGPFLQWVRGVVAE